MKKVENGIGFWRFISWTESGKLAASTKNCSRLDLVTGKRHQRFQKSPDETIWSSHTVQAITSANGPAWDGPSCIAGKLESRILPCRLVSEARTAPKSVDRPDAHKTGAPPRHRPKGVNSQVKRLQRRIRLSEEGLERNERGLALYIDCWVVNAKVRAMHPDCL